MTDEVLRPAAQHFARPHGFFARQVGPAMPMEPPRVDDLDVVRGLDSLAAVHALLVGWPRSPCERRRLTPAACTRGHAADELRRVCQRRCNDAHFGEAHRARKCEACVAQGLAWALLEQSLDGRREFRSGEAVGPSAWVCKRVLLAHGTRCAGPVLLCQTASSASRTRVATSSCCSG